jgi:ribose/xylose/arabinose/galactoside ABC-type transport system permease subunit
MTSHAIGPGEQPDLVRRLVGRHTREEWVDLLAVPFALLLICIVLSIIAPEFLTAANLRDVLVQASVLAMVAFGMTFVILAGELDLSVGTGVALASVVSALVMRDSQSVVLGVLAGIATGAALGIANGAIVTQLRVPSFIATLGTLEIARGIALALTNDAVIAGLPNSVSNIANGEFLGLSWPIWISAVVFVILVIVLRRTTFGVQVLAVGGNREAARLSTVPVNRVRLLTFVITGICVGISGVIVTARVSSGQPNTGNLLALTAIAAVVVGGTSLLGGRGSVTRTLWGILLISVVQNGLDLKGVNDDLQNVIIGLVFILAASTDLIRRRVRRRRVAQTALTGPAGESVGGSEEKSG